MEDTVISLFCHDFCQIFLPEWNQHLVSCGLKKRLTPSTLTPSEIMTIYIHFHQSHYRDFKHYYVHYPKFCSCNDSYCSQSASYSLTFSPKLILSSGLQKPFRRTIDDR